MQKTNSLIFKTLNGDLTVFNKTLISTKNHLKSLQAINAAVYNKNGAFNLQGLLVNSSQSVSTFTKLNNAFKAYNGNLSKSTQLQNAYIQVAGKQNITLGNYLAGLNGAKASMGGYIKSLVAAKAASIGLQAASIIGNMILFTAIAKGIQLATTAIDNWIHRVEKANEAMQDAVGEYESAKSSLENINSELAEQNKKINELLSKDKLTYTEKGQLEELQGITRELLLQQDIEQKRAEKASKDAASKAVDAYNKQYGKYDISREELNEKSENARISGIFPIVDSTNDITGNIVAYIRSTEILTEAQQNYEESLKSGIDTKYLDDDIQNTIDAVNQYSEILNENISDLQQKRLALEDEYNRAIEKHENGINLTSYEQETISTYKSIYDAIKLIYEYTNKNDWNNMEISSIFNTEGIEKTKEELISMYKSGELS